MLKDCPVRQITATCVTLLLISGCVKSEPDPAERADALMKDSAFVGLAQGENQEWSKADKPRDLTFPEDHGSHEEFRIEWWYYTGNLRAEDGREFGYQLTFFRTGIDREPNNPSRWTVRNLYTAHFALSDVKSRKHHFFQKTSRAGVGAAARGSPPATGVEWDVACRAGFGAAQTDR